jgi:hypothetical protein
MEGNTGKKALHTICKGTLIKRKQLPPTSTAGKNEKIIERY